MNELIKVEVNEVNEQIVSGRVLHEFLEVKDNYTDWFKRMISYGFDESVDFISLSEKSDKPFGGRPRVDHVLTLDTAKEISMIQRTAKGKKARKYFIEIEKRFREQAKLKLQRPTIYQSHNSLMSDENVGVLTHRGFESVRVAEIDGEIWYMAFDIVKIMGFKASATTIVRTYCSEEGQMFYFAD